MDQQKAVLDQVHKHLEQALAGLKDNPEAAAAVKKAIAEAHKHLAEHAAPMVFKFPQDGQGQNNFQWKAFPAQGAGAAGGGGGVRLGIVPESIPAALAEQLDLPKGVGVVVVEVVKGTPAEKAGIKTNDVILRIGDKDVPGDPTDVVKLVGGLKPGNVEVVVIRKGKKETLKGLTLPEIPTPEAQKKYRVLGDNKVSGEKKVKFNSMAVSVNDDEFTIKASNDAAKYVVEGTIKAGKPTAGTIRVTAGDKKSEYTSLEKVPAAHRAAVEQLLSSVGGEK